MDVHVPQAGDQKFAGGVDDAGLGWRLQVLPDSDNAIARYRHRDVRKRRPAGGIDYGGVLKDDALSPNGGNEREESEQPQQQFNSSYSTSG